MRLPLRDRKLSAGFLKLCLRKGMKAMTRKKNKRLRKLANKKRVLTPEEFVKDFYKSNRALMTELAYD